MSSLPAHSSAHSSLSPLSFHLLKNKVLRPQRVADRSHIPLIGPLGHSGLPSGEIEGAGDGGREGPAVRSRKHRPHLQVLGLRCVKEKVLNTRRSRGRAVSSGEARFYLQYTVLDEGREVNRSVRSRGRRTLASCGAQFQPGDGPWCLPRLIGGVRPLEQHGAMLGWPLPGAPGRGESLGPHLHSASGTL